MKKILIPTDFSPVADNALNYAIEIAAMFKSELLLYHVYTFHRKVDYNWDLPEDEQPFVKAIEKKMNFTKQKFMDKINQKGLTIQTMIEEDTVSSLFGKKIKKHNINLIIMGTNGATGLQKVIFGSTAATALEIAKVPVLVVPPHHSFLPLNQIVFATDLNEVASNILSPLQKVASQFNAKVTLFNVNIGANKSEPELDNFHLKDIDTTYKEVPLTNSVNESINAFIKQNKFDLMCMIRREKDFFENIYDTSVTKNQVYDNIIPLLVLPENQSTNGAL